MKILVTGGNGFIGKALCKKLKEAHKVASYDLPDCNILDHQFLELCISEVDLVVHCAAVADLNISLINQDMNFDVNIRATFDIARLCAEHKKKLVFISTCCVYGDSVSTCSDTPLHSVPMCREPYACSKVAGEYILRGTPGLDYVILRIGTVYGPGMREALFNYIALKKVLSGETIDIFGSGEQSRQYIYIDDLVDGISLAVDKFTEASMKTLNVCGLEKVSVLWTIQTAELLTGRTAIMRKAPARFGDTLEEDISCAETHLVLGWWAKVKYFEGMKRTLYGDERLKALLLKERVG